MNACAVKTSQRTHRGICCSFVANSKVDVVNDRRLMSMGRMNKNKCLVKVEEALNILFLTMRNMKSVFCISYE